MQIIKLQLTVWGHFVQSCYGINSFGPSLRSPLKVRFTLYAVNSISSSNESLNLNCVFYVTRDCSS